MPHVYRKIAEYAPEDRAARDRLLATDTTH